MDGLNAFCQSNLPVIYGVYGLAFFVTGIAVALESVRSSRLALSRALPFLAAFGLLHGLHEWTEMFQLMGPSSAQPWLVDWADPFSNILLSLSFVALMEFALRLVRLLDDEQARGWSHVTLGFVAAYVLSLLAYRVFAYSSDARLLWTVADILARYLLGIAGAAAACWAMFVQRRAFLQQGYAQVGRDLVGAALAFAWYVVFQFVVPPSPYFPSSVVNTATFLGWVGIPVQLFRAGVVGVLAFFIIRVMRVFELEYARRLDTLNHARFEAQASAARDLTVLYETCRILGTTLDLNALLNASLQKMVALISSVRAGAIFLYEPDDHAMRLRAICRAPDIAPSADFVPQARALALRACQTKAVAYGAERDGEAVLAIPLLSGEQVIGALCLSHAGAFANFAVMQTLARQLVIAIENAQLYAQVQEKEQLRGELLQRVVGAQEEERKRLARDLHDQTAQTLTALAVGITSVEELVGKDTRSAQQRLESLKAMSASAIDDLRQFIADLRPSLLDDLGLVAALREMAKQVQARSGLSVELRVTGERRRLRSQIETVLYRIAQEALNNSQRHAHAQQVGIALDFGAQVVTLSIADDGVGFAPERLRSATGKRRAWGLLGIQERTTLVGGTLDVQSAPGAGTRITAEIPYAWSEVDVDDPLVAG